MLSSFFLRLEEARVLYSQQVPSVVRANQFADGLFHWLFPVSDCEADLSVSEQQAVLESELVQLLRPLSSKLSASPEAVAYSFFQQIPMIYAALMEDAEAFYRNDPAAVSIVEVLAAYPGFKAIGIYRVAHQLHLQGVPLLPRLLSEYVHGQTGIDIHPSATIGRSFFIDHGTGVVIGATTIIGNEVRIYQGVTLGALQVDKSLATTKRHPTIEDNCVIYANSTILGGSTIIGLDSVIGGNTWLTSSVAPYSVVIHQPRISVRSKPFEEPINFVI